MVRFPNRLGFSGKIGKTMLLQRDGVVEEEEEVEIRERLEREILENKNDDSLRHILTLHQKKRKRTSK